jgi:hypothetical protein
MGKWRIFHKHPKKVVAGISFFSENQCLWAPDFFLCHQFGIRGKYKHLERNISSNLNKSYKWEWYPVLDSSLVQSPLNRNAYDRIFHGEGLGKQSAPSVNKTQTALWFWWLTTGKNRWQNNDRAERTETGTMVRELR